MSRSWTSTAFRSSLSQRTSLISRKHRSPRVAHTVTECLICHRSSTPVASRLRYRSRKTSVAGESIHGAAAFFAHLSSRPQDGCFTAAYTVLAGTAPDRVRDITADAPYISHLATTPSAARHGFRATYPMCCRLRCYSLLCVGQTCSRYRHSRSCTQKNLTRRGGYPPAGLRISYEILAQSFLVIH